MVKVGRDPSLSSFDAFEARQSGRAAAVLTLSLKYWIQVDFILDWIHVVFEILDWIHVDFILDWIHVVFEILDWIHAVFQKCTSVSNPKHCLLLMAAFQSLLQHNWGKKDRLAQDCIKQRKLIARTRMRHISN